MLPFRELKLSSLVYYRVFHQDIDIEELKWHMDEEDRVVIILNKTDWKFQFDNELPIDLYKYNTIEIPAGKYHRVIKGDSKKLHVLILKKKFKK